MDRPYIFMVRVRKRQCDYLWSLYESELKEPIPRQWSLHQLVAVPWDARQITQRRRNEIKNYARAPEAEMLPEFKGNGTFSRSCILILC